MILGVDELHAVRMTVKEQRWAVVDGVRAKVAAAAEGAQVSRDRLVACDIGVGL